MPSSPVPCSAPVPPAVVPTMKRFHPHVTAGRLRRGPSPYMVRQIGFSLLDARLPERGLDVHVRHITLFRSHLGPGGARYEPLFTAPVA